MKSESVNKVVGSEKTFPDGAFRESSMSGKFAGNSNCVEVAIIANGIGLRDSKDRSQPPLWFSRSDWIAFIKGGKAGEVDNYLFRQLVCFLKAPRSKITSSRKGRYRVNPWNGQYALGIPRDLILPYSGFPEVIDEILKNNAQTVLDVASGSGRHSIALAERGLLVDGFDLSPVAVAIATNEARERKLCCTFRLADMFGVFPYAANTFDAAVCVQAIYHGYRSNMMRALAEVSRVLKPGSLFFFTISQNKRRATLGARTYHAAKIDEKTFLPLSGRERGLVHFYPSRQDILEMLQPQFDGIRILEDKLESYFCVTCFTKK